MRYNRWFYNLRIDSKVTSKVWIIVAIAIGLLSTLLIYCFCYTFNDAIRLIYCGFSEDPFIFSVKERAFFNLFFAGFAVVLGNAIAVLILFSRPSSVLSSLHPLRRRILNDHIVLNFTFSFWFLKIVFGLGFFTLCLIDLNTLLHFEYYAYLALFVLYLESWKTLARVCRKHRLKIQLCHFLVLLGLTFALSKIDVINHKKIDALLLKNNPLIGLPESYYNQTIDWRNPNLHFKVAYNDRGNLVIYTQDRRQIQLEDMPSEIIKEREVLREELIPYLTVQLSIKKTLKIIDVKKIETLLLKVGQRRIAYRVNDAQADFVWGEPIIIEHKISKDVLAMALDKNIIAAAPSSLDLLDFKTAELVFDTVEVSIKHNFVSVNGEIVPKEQLVHEFEQRSSKNICFKYLYNETTTYQDYITVFSAHCKAISNLRRTHQTLFIEHQYRKYKAYNEEQRHLAEKFPIQITESLNNTIKH